jgi:serine protease Do
VIATKSGAAPEMITAGEQGFLGIDASAAQTVTEEFAERFNMPIGIYINDVIKNSPADKAGLKQGNIIVGLDNVTIKSIDDLVNVLSYKKAGQEIDLKIKEKVGGEYKDKTLKVTLGKKD